MKQSIVHMALVVRDYDEAIDFYTKTLHFTLVEDTYRSRTNAGWSLLRQAQAVQHYYLQERQNRSKNWKPDGWSRISLSEHRHFWRDYNEMVERGIRFVREPKTIVWHCRSIRGLIWQSVGPRAEMLCTRCAACYKRKPFSIVCRSLAIPFE